MTSNKNYKNGKTSHKGSKPKPIKSKSIQFLKFGNYFKPISKSPIFKKPKKLTTNNSKIIKNNTNGKNVKNDLSTQQKQSIIIVKDKEEKEEKKENGKNNNNQLMSNFAGTGLLSSIINNNTKYPSMDQRLSSSSSSQSKSTSLNINSNKNGDTITSIQTLSYHSNSNSLDGNEMDKQHPIYYNNLNSPPPSFGAPTTFNIQNSINTRVHNRLKEYIDAESTVSSSDIQDDISSVASDDSRRGPPRNPPPPIPSFSARMNNRRRNSKRNQQLKPTLNPLSASNSYGIIQNKSNPLNLKIITKTILDDLDNKKRKSKSQFSTPTDSPLLTPNIAIREDDKVNPYLAAFQFNQKIKGNNNNHLTTSSLPPPPLSPTSPTKNIQTTSKPMHVYRARNGSKTRQRTNSLPYYEKPKMHGKSKSYSVLPRFNLNNKQNQTSTPNPSNMMNRKHINGRAVSHDFNGNNNNNNNNSVLKNRQNRLHQRANSARVVDDLSLSEKLYQNRRTVLHRLSRGKNKKDIMSKLDISIGKVEEKLKQYVRLLVSFQDEKMKINNMMNKDISDWENINNFGLTNLCRSYYSNFKLLLSVKIEVQTKYCECFRDKHRELKKTRDRIKKDARKYTLDDLILSVEAAMMTASNIRLPSDINILRENEKSLNLVVRELSIKYQEKKYDDIIKPMTKEDRTKHILTMLVQIIDTSNKTTSTKNVSDGLPYFHPEDNGYQVPFEQILYDPRFNQKDEITKFIARYHLLSDLDKINIKIINRENLSLTRISTFVYKLTNSFLDSCSLNKDSAFYQKLFWDSTNLMIGRSIFPKFRNVIKYIISKDVESSKLDEKYKKQLIWMSTLSQKQIGIDKEFQFYYTKKIKNLKPKISFKKPKKSLPISEALSKEDCIAYYRPISRFKLLPDITVPQDSIVLVIDTIHDLQKCAMKYHKIYNELNKIKNGKKNQVIISGDTLFPIVVYCLIQSNVSYWNQWIFMMQKFYTKQILQFGQTGFCFSLINAATKYISEQKPSNFGLDDDIQ